MKYIVLLSLLLSACAGREVTDGEIVGAVVEGVLILTVGGWI